MPPDRFAELGEAASRLGLTLTAIREVGAGTAVTWVLNGQGYVPKVLGYDHFR